MDSGQIALAGGAVVLIVGGVVAYDQLYVKKRERRVAKAACKGALKASNASEETLKAFDSAFKVEKDDEGE